MTFGWETWNMNNRLNSKTFELRGVINKFENIEYATIPNKNQNFF